MLTLKDPMRNALPLPDGIELSPLREPESLEMPVSYVPSSGATMMTSNELAEVRPIGLPPEAGLDRIGTTVHEERPAHRV
jgi:hypothetical protein